MYETLEVFVKDRVGWLVFDRPDAGNAMNSTMLTELEAAWKELDSDPDVRVIVNSGNGSSFNSGLDVRELNSNRDALREQSRRTRDATLKLTSFHNNVWKPVIVAVNGTCAGGGLHFVSDADIVLMTDQATLVDPHTSIGQVSAYEVITLARKTSFEPVSRMALVGRHERLDSRRALELGICSEVLSSPEALRTEAERVAQMVARNSPAALRATKRALWGTFEMGLTDACRYGCRELVDMWGHADQFEGPAAFAARREAQWAD
jgi:enoyl-CoA hydratase